MNFTVIEEGGDISPTKIKVVGVGGGGSNAVNRMIQAQLGGVEFVAVNTDQQALHKSLTSTRLSIGRKVTNGLGAGGDPSVGEKAAIEDKEAIKEILLGSDMVFITAGMGGGTGTGAAPVIAEVARELDILTVAVVTKPFEMEGRWKMKLAQQGVDRLRKHVDTVLVIPNENLFNVVDRKTTVEEAFRHADDILRRGVQGISDLITKPGLINIDFADVRTVMKGKGDALMGVGYGDGEGRATAAATNAMNNPLLEDACIDGAQSILVNVRSSNCTLEELNDIVKMITSAAHPDANIISGTATEEGMEDRIEVTLVATGFEDFEGQRTHYEGSATQEPGLSFKATKHEKKYTAPQSRPVQPSLLSLGSRQEKPAASKGGQPQHSADSHNSARSSVRQRTNARDGGASGAGSDRQEWLIDTDAVMRRTVLKTTTDLNIPTYVRLQRAKG